MCLPPYFSNVITHLVTLPAMASWAKPVVEHIRQNRHKHAQQPQKHFVGQIILALAIGWG